MNVGRITFGPKSKTADAARLPTKESAHYEPPGMAELRVENERLRDALIAIQKGLDVPPSFAALVSINSIIEHALAKTQP